MSRNTTTLKLITNCKQLVFIINIIFSFSPPQGFVWFIKSIHFYVITFLFNTCFIDFFCAHLIPQNSSNCHDWFLLPSGLLFSKIQDGTYKNHKTGIVLISNNHFITIPIVVSSHFRYIFLYHLFISVMNWHWISKGITSRLKYTVIRSILKQWLDALQNTK